jgi:hypothetical protein
MVPNATPMINLRAIQTGMEVHKARAIIRTPAPNIPTKRVRFTPYCSMDLPTKGALIAIPTNMAVAVIPIMGVGICLASRITDVTGIMIPQESPTVNTAMITVDNGVMRRFINDLFLEEWDNFEYLS